MISCNSYQDIKSEEELEEERDFDAELSSMLREYDAEFGVSFQKYKQCCIRQLRARRNRK